MPLLKKFLGKSQYDSDIHLDYRSSACGPVTASVILLYLNSPKSRVSIDELYKLLGTTRIGLFSWRFVHKLRKLLGRDWEVSKCTLSWVLNELDQGRPAAAKFDKWFTFNWRSQSEFAYHWVPVIGYEIVNQDVLLAIHDNGSPNSSSQVRYVSYRANQSVLSFVRITPKTTAKGH
ncbi:C39 family peptidase [Sporosarcina aquimarina]|uniref:C39 family peptidase n=1 Tax=Sporosarcina aquimarina TaxID=114975 RepID=A0ABU4G208_9BACL|nr:C39 family peptidase [Sporosarcina aquimarina]MDW0110998.1 C39 family peptidase [Sporosarcina aquimarina]